MTKFYIQTKRFRTYISTVHHCTIWPFLAGALSRIKQHQVASAQLATNWPCYRCSRTFECSQAERDPGPNLPVGLNWEADNWYKWISIVIMQYSMITTA